MQIHEQIAGGGVYKYTYGMTVTYLAFAGRFNDCDRSQTYIKGTSGVNAPRRKIYVIKYVSWHKKAINAPLNTHLNNEKHDAGMMNLNQRSVTKSEADGLPAFKLHEFSMKATGKSKMKVALILVEFKLLFFL